MDTAAYYLALVTVTTGPAVLLFWFLIHPFADLWRRLGAVPTYVIVCTILVLIMASMYQIREPVLSIRFGVRPWLLILSVLTFVVAIYFGVRRMRHLKVSVMLGMPEISSERTPGKLITEGIFAQVRNPRYLEGGFGLLAVALFTNYLAVYILFAAYLPIIYLVVLLEERELTKRFGKEYQEYCRRVPRFVPTFVQWNAKKE